MLPPGACIGSPIFHGEVVCISSAQQSRRDEEVVALVMSIGTHVLPAINLRPGVDDES